MLGEGPLQIYAVLLTANGVLTNGELYALREGTPLTNEKLEALRNFALAVVRKRGWVDEADQQAFADAGYSRRQALDVIAAVSFKTLTNYVNHLADPPVDEPFQPQAWQPPAES